MALSDHQQIAEAVKLQVDAWGSLPAGWVVARSYSYTRAVGQLPEGTDGAVTVMAVAVDGDREDRTSDRDEVTVAVVLTIKLDNIEAATIDAVDLLAESLRNHLRTLRTISIASGRKASRLGTSLPTPHDADWLHEKEIFVSVIECRYFMGVQVD